MSTELYYFLSSKRTFYTIHKRVSSLVRIFNSGIVTIKHLCSLIYVLLQPKVLNCSVILPHTVLYFKTAELTILYYLHKINYRHPSVIIVGINKSDVWFSSSSTQVYIVNRKVKNICVQSAAQTAIVV